MLSRKYNFQALAGWGCRGTSACLAGFTWPLTYIPLLSVLAGTGSPVPSSWAGVVSLENILLTAPPSVEWAVLAWPSSFWTMMSGDFPDVYLHSESRSPCQSPRGWRSFPLLLWRTDSAPFHFLHASLPGEGWVGHWSFVRLPVSAHWS